MDQRKCPAVQGDSKLPNASQESPDSPKTNSNDNASAESTSGHRDDTIKPAGMDIPARPHRLWAWVSPSAPLLQATITLIVGVGTISIASEVRNISKNQSAFLERSAKEQLVIAKLQAEVAKASIEPIIDLRIENTEAKEQISVLNIGAPLLHLRVDITTLLPVAHAVRPGKSDEDILLIEVADWFNSYEITDRPEGTLMTARGRPARDRLSKLIYQIPPGKGFHEWNPQGDVQHFVRVRFENKLGTKEDRILVVKRDAYVQINEVRGRELLEAFSGLPRYEQLDLDKDSISRIQHIASARLGTTRMTGREHKESDMVVVY